MHYFKYIIEGCAHYLFPTETHFGLFGLDDNTEIDIPQQYPFSSEWGQGTIDNVMLRDTLPAPNSFRIAYLSIVEKKFYYVSTPINASEASRFMKLFDDGSHSKLLVGMAPYGSVALWFGNKKKQILLGYMEGSEIDITMSEFLPTQLDSSLIEYCERYICADHRVKENLENNGLPLHNMFDNYMKQFTYRYFPIFEHWNENKHEWTKYEQKDSIPKCVHVEEKLFDGTYDKLHDGSLMNYHQAGKPMKLSLKWIIKKSEYTAYFWFKENEIQTIFDRFYGAHPETKTDFMIRIDSERKKIELSLYRYGLKEPQVISESAYQLLVFKNKFEYYRNENYNQPEGAWIW